MAAAEGEVGEFLDNEPVLATITRMAQKTKSLSQEQLAAMGTKEFDETVLPQGGLEETLALSEVLGTLVKHGLTPLNTPNGPNTVEGFSKLQAALVQAYRDNELVPTEVRLKAAELEKSLDIITTTRAFVVQAEQFKARTSAILAERDATMAVSQAQADTVVGSLAQQNRLLREAATTKQERVQIASISKSADIDAEVLKLKKQAEAIKKRRAARRERAQALVGPYKRRAKMLIIVLVCIANLVADTPGREQTFVLGRVNRMWDAVYTPLRDGVLNTYHNVRSDMQ